MFPAAESARLGDGEGGLGLIKELLWAMQVKIVVFEVRHLHTPGALGEDPGGAAPSPSFPTPPAWPLREKVLIPVSFEKTNESQT